MNGTRENVLPPAVPSSGKLEGLSCMDLNQLLQVRLELFSSNLWCDLGPPNLLVEIGWIYSIVKKQSRLRRDTL